MSEAGLTRVETDGRPADLGAAPVPGERLGPALRRDGRA